MNKFRYVDKSILCSYDLSEDFLNKKDDYNFVSCDKSKINEAIEQIIKYSLSKNIDERNLQVLAPMYRGENGIDALNVLLQNIYNPRSKMREEITYGDIIYRENDKVIQLVNDLDNNVFNGDVGFIESIYNNKIIILQLPLLSIYYFPFSKYKALNCTYNFPSSQSI